MASVFPKRGKWWARLKGDKEPGKWSSVPTGETDRDAAMRFARAAQRAIRSRCQRSVPALAWWPSPAPSFPSEQPRPAVRFCLGAR